jgi:hypothetical protein
MCFHPTSSPCGRPATRATHRNFPIFPSLLLQGGRRTLKVKSLTEAPEQGWPSSSFLSLPYLRACVLLGSSLVSFIKEKKIVSPLTSKAPKIRLVTPPLMCEMTHGEKDMK